MAGQAATSVPGVEPSAGKRVVGLLPLGGLALIFPLVAAVWVTAVLALVFVMAALVGWLMSLVRARHRRGPQAFWRFAVTTLLLLAGIWMVSRSSRGPVASARPEAALVLVIEVVVLLEETVAGLVSLTHRHLQVWGWGTDQRLGDPGAGRGDPDGASLPIRFHGLANDGPRKGKGRD